MNVILGRNDIGLTSWIQVTHIKSKQTFFPHFSHGLFAADDSKKTCCSRTYDKELEKLAAVEHTRLCENGFRLLNLLIHCCQFKNYK